VSDARLLFHYTTIITNMKLDTALFQSIAQRAAESPRLRMHYDLRDSEQENGQRMLNVLLKGTTENIHRHLDTNEVVACLQGTVLEQFYDDQGNITEEVTLSAGGDTPAILIEQYRWHSISPITDVAVVLTTKAGRFNPDTTEFLDKE